MKSNNNILSFLIINDLKKHKIYLIKNLINNKEYVGQTIKTIEERFNEHCKSPYYIGDAIRKYGPENFTIEILVENLSREEAGELEKYYIKERNTLACNGHGYNIHEGGTGGNMLAGMSEAKKREYSKKISKAKIGQKHSEETKQKMRKPKSEEHKQNISKGQKGKPRPYVTEMNKKKKGVPNPKLSEIKTFKYTQEESDFILQQHLLGLSPYKIYKPFNERFNKNISRCAITNYIKKQFHFFAT